MSEVILATCKLFSAWGVIAFVLGMAFEYVFLKARCKYLDYKYPKGRPRTVKIKRVYVVWALVFIVIGGLTYKAQTTSDQVVSLIKDTQDCSREFNAALKARADINKEESAINARWQDANFERTKKLTELLSKYTSSVNPEYARQRIPIDQKYYELSQKIFMDRDANILKRAQTPYPEPNCGK